MTDEEFEETLVECSDDQVDSLRALRLLTRSNAQVLREGVNPGRWLNGYVFYSADGQMIYAIGPKGKTKTTLHMMPYYGSPLLQERHGEALATFLAGKSCIAFRKYSELPLEALTDIIRRGTPVMVAMIEEPARAKQARPPARRKNSD